MRKILFAALLVLSFNAAKSQILAWNFDADVKGNERTSLSTYNDPNLEVSILSRGPGINAEKATLSFASAFPVNLTKEEAIKAGAYYQFTVRPREGYQAALETLNVILRAQPNAPKQYRWMYSTDGIKFINLGKGDVKIKTTVNNGIAQPTLDLSLYEDLKNITSDQTIVFRLYAWGGTEGSKQNGFRIGKSNPSAHALSVSGKVFKQK